MASTKPENEPRSTGSVLGSVLAVSLCAFAWCAVITFDAGDWPSPHRYPNPAPPVNACGLIGAWCAYQLRWFLGDGVFPLLLFTSLITVTRIVGGVGKSFAERAFGLALLVTCTSASTHLIAVHGSGQLPVGHGGLIGHALGDLMRNHLDSLGTFIVLSASFLVGLTFVTDGWVLRLPSLLRSARPFSAAPAELGGKFAACAVGSPDDASRAVSAAERAALLSRRRNELQGRTRGDLPIDSSVAAPVESTCDSRRDRIESVATPKSPRDASSPKEPGAQPPEDEAATSARPRPERGGRPATGPIVKFLTPQTLAAAEPYPRQIENWTLPPITLLNQPEFSFTAQQEAVVRKQAQVLEQTLAEFRVDAQVVEIDTGPVITMFELRLGAGIKVSQIAALANDMARALRAHAIRVVAPISGKNTVGVEVPNVGKETVRLRELMTTAGKKASEMALPLFLAKDAGGQPLVADLTKMPHLLIAGTTGSGKSVCLNSVILSLLMTKRPDHVKLILIDPKMVELNQFKEVPHLMCPIVTDMLRAEKILAWAVTKMDERYEMLAEARVKNIDGYNALGAAELYARLNPASEMEKARIPTHVPFIVILIDELADLMMTSAKEVEHHLSRLAQKSRAVGIHIIVATQRPEAKVVTGLIKSNLPSRICFRVASRMDSRIVLDQNGGEVLLGQGDMLFLPPGAHKLVRAQGTFVEDAELQAVLNDLTARAQPDFHPELIRIKSGTADEPSEGRDPLFDAAVEIIVQSQRGSVSLLQRRLTIGYSRASRLIDQMAQAGIVGDYKGSQAREVLMTVDQWRSLRRQVEVEQAAGYEADNPESGSPHHSTTDWDEDHEPVAAVGRIGS